MSTANPKRLIEVDLPIKRISAHARREKSIRYGHISTLHIWWARRPLAACRAVILAALWPDPADECCPPHFLDEARRSLEATLGGQTRVNIPNRDYSDAMNVRAGLLDFIAEFANWDNSSIPEYAETARKLTQTAHEALGGQTGARPLVADPFAGGGSIPLEALRVGADAYASDLNPIPVLLNRVALEFIPRYGEDLADQVRKWGNWVQEKASAELARFYPSALDGSFPIGYLWARTILSEGPDEEEYPIEVPILRSMWLAKASSSDRALRWVRNENGMVVTQVIEKTFANGSIRKVRQPLLDIVSPTRSTGVGPGTSARGAVTCPVTGFTTPVTSVRKQLFERRGGADDARLLAIRQGHRRSDERTYRLPEEADYESVREAVGKLKQEIYANAGSMSLTPDEPLPADGVLGFRVQKYGMKKWQDLFTPRQLLSLTVIGKHLRAAGDEIARSEDAGLALAVQSCLALTFGRLADFSSSLCTLNATGNRGVFHTFARQAVPMVWDFMETVPLNPIGANWLGGLDTLEATIRTLSSLPNCGIVEAASALQHPLPDESVSAFCTDPPYYDAVPYSDLSDYFYVWLKRVLPPGIGFDKLLTPKDDECIVDWSKKKDKDYYERAMARAMSEGRRILLPNGIGFVVFANKTTSGWEAILQAMLNAGWTITASWPIDTERPGRLRAMNSAALTSSVHLVCRPRIGNPVGEWRDVLAELPTRIHNWMPRLQEEGVVGADAIFACLGPALEVFSRYARVEKASGDPVTLREYLEQVWAAVSKEALGMIFQNADASGLEQDARLTAIWFWVLKAARIEEVDHGDGQDEEVDEPSEPTSSSKHGFALEFDAARKLAQGLGVDLYELSRPGGILKVSGSISTLFRVSEREHFLFGQQLSLFDDISPASSKPRRLPNPSMSMKAVPQRQEQLFDEEPTPRRDPERPLIPGLVFPSDDRSSLERLKDRGTTTLDRLHQAMLLFGRSQVAMLGPFLIDTGMAFNDKFWILAQSLSALYPPGTEEKRWVDGVLARKKGLGF
jgi:putative DNA methylase